MKYGPGLACEHLDKCPVGRATNNLVNYKKKKIKVEVNIDCWAGLITKLPLGQNFNCRPANIFSQSGPDDRDFNFFTKQ